MGPLISAAIAAEDRDALLQILSLECHYGTVLHAQEDGRCPEYAFLAQGSGGADTTDTGSEDAGIIGGTTNARSRSSTSDWRVALSTFPWMEGTSFGTVAADIASSVGGHGHGGWKVFESCGWASGVDAGAGAAGGPPSEENVAKAIAFLRSCALKGDAL